MSGLGGCIPRPGPGSCWAWTRRPGSSRTGSGGWSWPGTRPAAVPGATRRSGTSTTSSPGPRADPPPWPTARACVNAATSQRKPTAGPPNPSTGQPAPSKRPRRPATPTPPPHHPYPAPLRADRQQGQRLRRVESEQQESRCFWWRLPSGKRGRATVVALKPVLRGDGLLSGFRGRNWFALQPDGKERRGDNLEAGSHAAEEPRPGAGRRRPSWRPVRRLRLARRRSWRRTAGRPRTCRPGR